MSLVRGRTGDKRPAPRATCRRFRAQLATNGSPAGDMSPVQGPTGDKRQALGRDVAGSGPNWRQTASPAGEMSPVRFPTGDKRPARGRDVAGSRPNWRQTAGTGARCRRIGSQLATNGRPGAPATTHVSRTKTGRLTRAPRTRMPTDTLRSLRLVLLSLAGEVPAPAIGAHVAPQRPSDLNLAAPSHLQSLFP